MIVQMKKNVTKEELEKLQSYLKEKGLGIKDASSAEIVLFGILGDTKSLDPDQIKVFAGVENVTRISSPYKLASKAFRQEPTVITLKNGVKIGSDEFVVMAGPCSVESEEQLTIIAEAVKAAGSKILRGGVFKPRTSPYAFQGLGIEGLKMMRKVADKLDMAIVTELMGTEHLEEFVKYTDIIQIGARNMQNFDLLKAIGKYNVPVLLKRGLSNTIEEWLMSAEYIMASGNEQVILCERGIRTFEKYTRNTLDISAVLAVRELSHLPVIVDPSHAAGKWEMIESLSLASLAVGADGIIVEVHHDPERAFSDGPQSLKPKQFSAMMDKLEKLSTVLEKKIVR
ncbi:3-deoxy-7-phosphoheptulonate synthase [Acholeplasma equirhinis]|uniref:3-deoxy-7-phosphoheptulonate synthase n=1 Tax=Acholeplasma equirhinis TaxID=555393 RepID=UPI00197AD8E9|nr:3-deoxy-7-phosphoheptulonate synthase [Acholeplasma equirhinis]MBN3490835.1 3-deoxy-7-phosphoheptulonate synthase [Acholeplasma equirhinis]